MMDTGNVYETEKSLQQYLLFHYGSRDESMLWDFGPKNGLEFPLRCAQLCEKHWKRLGQSKASTRALDIGCAVGRSTFELSRTFDEVVGIDYSQSFVDTCHKLKHNGKLAYLSKDHGEIHDRLIASISDEIDRTKCTFEQGDACALSKDKLGKFNLILAANLICRLNRPQDFLDSMKDMVEPGGLLVITSPYSFSEDYTPRENLIGGLARADGTNFTGFEGLQLILGPDFTLVEETDMPFSIKETRRFHQWTVAHATVWQRK